MLALLRRKTGSPLPGALYDLSLDMFAIVEHWDPGPMPGPERGRAFEQILYRYCDLRRWHIRERAGARTVRAVYAASGFMHETDGVITTPEFTVMLELKYLGCELGKNELLVFNQKGLDVLAGDCRELRSKPLFRVVVSGTILSPAARRFAALWGILVVEPDRLPLPVLHWFAGSDLETTRVDPVPREQIWAEVPNFVTPLQTRVRRAAQVLDGGDEMVSRWRVDRMLDDSQRIVGDHYWSAMDEKHPGWLEDHYDAISAGLRLDA